MLTILLVVPCYNEEDRLRGDLFIQAIESHEELQILFVDDGSTDDTWRLVDGLAGHRSRRVAALRLTSNSGKAEAVRQGFLFAFERNFDLIGFWDADLATPLDELARLTKEFADQRVRVVTGARVAMLGRQIERSQLRHYVGRVFATAASLILGVAVYDTQCGAKLFRNTAEIRSIFAHRFASSWTFDVEILAHLALQSRFLDGPGLEHSVIEKPLLRWVDIDGSKIRLHHGLLAAWELVRIAWLLHGPVAQKNLRTPEKTE